MAHTHVNKSTIVSSSSSSSPANCSLPRERARIVFERMKSEQQQTENRFRMEAAAAAAQQNGEQNTQTFPPLLLLLLLFREMKHHIHHFVFVLAHVLSSPLLSHPNFIVCVRIYSVREMET
jgi:hypothetical protein